MPIWDDWDGEKPNLRGWANAFWILLRLLIVALFWLVMGLFVIGVTFLITD